MNEAKATRYQRLRRRAQLVSVAAAGALLLLVAVTPAAHLLSGFATNLSLGWPDILQPVVALGIVVAVLALATEVVALPASLWAAKLEVSTQARDALVGALIVFGIAGTIRLSMWMAGAAWWALASLMLAAATLVALRILATGLAASGETRPLARPALAQALVALATRACGTSVDVREWTSPTAAGASVTGVGQGGQVLLSHEMVRDWADDEIVVVVAHELSHHAHHDIARTVVVDAALWCLTLGIADRVVAIWGPALGLSGVTDLAALPLLTVSAGAVWGLLRPLRLAQSRAHERRADSFALEHTGDTEAFGRALRRLGEQYLAEERPSRLTRWFFHRHPPLDERLAFGQRFSARRR